MEGNSANNSSSSSSSLASELFGGKDREVNSSSSGLFSSVFPHPYLVGEKGSATTDIFNSPKKQEYADQAWNQAHKATADDYMKGNMSKENKYINKDKSSSYKGERSDPCFLSNSLYYGGQDICAQPPTSETSESSYNYEKDGKDNSDFASRGNWWQGSLYY